MASGVWPGPARLSIFRVRMRSISRSQGKRRRSAEIHSGDGRSLSTVSAPRSRSIAELEDADAALAFVFDRGDVVLHAETGRIAPRVGRLPALTRHFERSLRHAVNH